MSEKPILFSGPMVRAIMDGRKTITRRIVKPQPRGQADTREEDRVYPWPESPTGWSMSHIQDSRYTYQAARCPYGRPGDRLWVREAFQAYSGLEFDAPMYVYRATDNTAATRWRPSIHMPRCASRITLEVVAVRVERLHDIDEADARSEGAPAIAADDASIVPADILARLRDLHTPSYTLGFASVWMEINGAGSWAANPWVWVVEFRRVEA